MMSELMKRFFALLLAMTITIGLMPVSALATEVSEERLTASEIPADSVDTEETEVDESEETADTQTPEDDLLIEDEGVGYALEGRAVGDTTYVLAGSDFQPSDDNTATGASQVTAILNQVKIDYPSFDGFLFAGDYEYNSTNNATESKNGVVALQKAVRDIFGENMDEVLVQGNHDPDSLVTDGILSPSGNNDTESYGVFVINEKDYMWRNDNEATIRNTAKSLETYLNAKRNAEYAKPIFVISHLALHYSMRTRNDGDGMYANYIFNVLNKAGNAGLNIIYLYGHDHSHGWDDYLGGAAIFLTDGDNINIAQSSKTEFKEETLSFTYMNAGYVGYYGTSYTSDVDKTLTMTTFAITDTDVTISRYDANGTHNLKSAGVYNVEYPDSAYYTTDTTTVGTPYKLTLNTEITPAGEEVNPPDSGNTGTGATERTYTRITSTSELVSGDKYLIIHNGQNDFMVPEVTSDGGTRIGYDLVSGPDGLGNNTITGNYQNNEWIFESTSGGWKIGSDYGYMTLQAAGDRHAAQLTGNGDTMVIEGSEDHFTFTSATYSNGTYVLNYNGTADLINGYASSPAPFYIYRLTSEGSSSGSVDTSGGDWITITEPTEAGIRYTYVLDKDGIDTDVKYLIVANTYAKAMSAAAGDNNAIDVSIDGEKAYADSDDYGWTFANDGYYYRIQLGSTYLGNNNGIVSIDSWPNKQNTQNRYRWTVISNSDGSYSIVNLRDSAYELRWSNSNGVFQSSSSNDGPVRLYKYNGTETVAAKPGLFGKISGELTYNVDIGTSAAEALAAVKAGIDILYHNGDANAAQTFPDDGDGMTWTLDPYYDGVTAGEYAVTIKYNDVVLGTAKVVVPTVAVKSYSLDPMEATVRQGAGQLVNTGSMITVTLENDTYFKVPVTISMLSKNGDNISTAVPGEQTGLTVTYNGVVITNGFTLNVTERVYNNYPEYPDEGAVKVNKTATGIDFQSSGIAQVEISASGVPIRKGADVVIVIDTSSSMDEDINGGSGEPARIDILSDALEDMLNTFNQPDDNGYYPDIDIAIIDFNGFSEEIPGTSLTNSYRNNADLAEVYTGPEGKTGFINDATVNNVSYKGVGLSAENFVENTSINAAEMAGQFTEEKTYSGTNYDGGLRNAYLLLSMKKAANDAVNDDRDQYVIFMSDGAPFRYNGFNENSGNYTAWNRWLNGEWEDTDAFDAEFDNPYAHFYNGNGSSHPHRIAEAIKGTEGEGYYVVDSTMADANPKYMSEISGLGATIYAVGFGLSADREVTVPTMQNVLRSISSGDDYFFDVDTAEGLTTAFTQIANAINYAAENARFVDQMGGNFNLQMKTATYIVRNDDNTTTTKTLVPKIEVVQYAIWTRQDYEKRLCMESQIGDRKVDGDGDYISTILETVTFTSDVNGNISGAYSDQIDGGKTNILAPKEETETDGYVDGVIYAKTFMYNTNIQAVAVEGVTIPTGKDTSNLTTGSTNVLPKETFYWKMGTVQTSELAMRYFVYLDGSMEGTKEAGSYATNEFATLYYDNYLGNPCYKDTVSPTMAWKSANVSYAFYLVNEKGEIIVNQTTGQTGSFANKIAVTNPVVYEEILLNNTDQVQAIDVQAIDDDVLPKYYDLYDDSAVYEVTINSNSTGAWEITKGSGKVESTYVTNFGTRATYSNALSNNTVGDDYTHTIVWFAVVWTLGANPDSVVVDYGLPVDISVLTNDMFGEYGKLAGIGAYTAGIESTTAGESMPDGFGTNYTGTYGTATTDSSTGKVRYTLNTMEMPSYEKFAYAVNYTGGTNAGYYYDTITVIPSTTIYYEDGFLNYTGFGTAWEDAVDKYDGSGYVQDEDRPGKYSLTDANNIYGFDSVNKGMSTYSLGNAKKVHVDAGSYATAEFTFAGTGFDVISMTSNDTGLLVVQVYDSNNEPVTEPVTAFSVDTYYGYTAEYYNVTYTYSAATGKWSETKGTKLDSKPEDGPTALPAENLQDGDTIETWKAYYVLTPDNGSMLYQVPVIQVENLTYGTYRVVLTATYANVFDHKPATDGFDLYLDAIRIYDPANDGAADGTVDTTIEDTYKVDGEGWPSYIELRNKIITANSFDKPANDALSTDMEGLVFIDGDASIGDVQISDYISYGPNNEVYLAPGQRVAFMLNTPDNIANVHIGIKSADGKTGTYTITNIAIADKENSIGDNVSKGQYYNARTFTINTTTDMYYDLTGWKGDIIVISNTGDRYNTTGIISLTNIKSTYDSNPNGTQTVNEGARTSVAAVQESNETYVYMTRSAAQLVVKALEDGDLLEKAPEIVIPEETEPDETEPEETEPEETEPEETEPDETEPEETEPEETGPEESEPEETEPEETEPEETEPQEKPFDPGKVKLPFKDVKKESWYQEGVAYVYFYKLMNGISEEEFAPSKAMTRAMVVTVLYRLAGEPETDFDAKYSDVKANKYYSDAINWATENGIAFGIGSNKFDPDGEVTREQLATMLYRYSKLKGYDLSTEEDLLDFPDFDEVSKWSKDGMKWAVGNGIINGNKKGNVIMLDPASNALRSQIAVILQRFCESFE